MPSGNQQASHIGQVAPLSNAFRSPARWPHPRSVASFGHQSLEGPGANLDVCSRVLRRVVTPEAHEKFHRILCVTQSEIERLMMFKVQELFGPVRPEDLSALAVEELGRGSAELAAARLPGTELSTKLLGQSVTRSGSLDRRGLCQEKAVKEACGFARHAVGILARILADFASFADIVLRWQVDESHGGAEANIVDDDQQDSALTPPVGVPDLVERLDRQNKCNSELEKKYDAISSELRENRRAFLRERLVWQERVRMLQSFARQHGYDPAISGDALGIEHDVTYFGSHESEHDMGGDLEALRSQYEREMLVLKDASKMQIEKLELDIERLQDRLEKTEKALRSAEVSSKFVRAFARSSSRNCDSNHERRHESHMVASTPKDLAVSVPSYQVGVSVEEVARLRTARERAESELKIARQEVADAVAAARQAEAAAKAARLASCGDGGRGDAAAAEDLRAQQIDDLDTALQAVAAATTRPPKGIQAPSEVAPSSPSSLPSCHDCEILGLGAVSVSAPELDGLTPSASRECGEVSTVFFSMKVTNLNYDGLLKDATLLLEFQKNIIAAIGSEAGGEISQEHINISLRPGSVVIILIIDVAISPPAFIGANVACSKLTASTTLTDSVVTNIQNVLGIEAISSGTIYVSIASPPTVHIGKQFATAYRVPVAEQTLLLDGIGQLKAAVLPCTSVGLAVEHLDSSASKDSEVRRRHFGISGWNPNVTTNGHRRAAVKWQLPGMTASVGRAPKAIRAATVAKRPVDEILERSTGLLGHGHPNMDEVPVAPCDDVEPANMEEWLEVPVLTPIGDAGVRLRSRPSSADAIRKRSSLGGGFQCKEVSAGRHSGGHKTGTSECSRPSLLSGSLKDPWSVSGTFQRTAGYPHGEGATPPCCDSNGESKPSVYLAIADTSLPQAERKNQDVLLEHSQHGGPTEYQCDAEATLVPEAILEPEVARSSELGRRTASAPCLAGSRRVGGGGIVCGTARGLVPARRAPKPNVDGDKPDDLLSAMHCSSSSQSFCAPKIAASSTPQPVRAALQGQLSGSLRRARPQSAGSSGLRSRRPSQANAEAAARARKQTQ